MGVMSIADYVHVYLHWCEFGHRVRIFVRY